MKKVKKVKTALAAVTASLLLATGLAGTANAKDYWNYGITSHMQMLMGSRW